jgi:hypothetical protein
MIAAVVVFEEVMRRVVQGFELAGVSVLIFGSVYTR